jgi:hypothetical protein
VRCWRSSYSSNAHGGPSNEAREEARLVLHRRGDLELRDLGRFIKALVDEHSKGTVEPSGYYPAHIVLIVINFVLGLVFLWFGLKVLRAERTAQTSAPSK